MSNQTNMDFLSIFEPLHNYLLNMKGGRNVALSMKMSRTNPIKTENQIMTFALYDAVFSGNDEIVKLLLEHCMERIELDAKFGTPGLETSALSVAETKDQQHSALSMHTHRQTLPYTALYYHPRTFYS